VIRFIVRVAEVVPLSRNEARSRRSVAPLATILGSWQKFCKVFAQKSGKLAEGL